MLVVDILAIDILVDNILSVDEYNILINKNWFLRDF